MLIIDLDTKSVKGYCKAGEIKNKGLVKASVEDGKNGMGKAGE